MTSSRIRSDFDRFMFNKTKNKKHFCKCCLQSFSSKEILIEHKKRLFSDKW